MIFLHMCFQDNPLELIKGIGSEYEAAWGYLEFYLWISKVYVGCHYARHRKKALQPGEDARFCALVHLILTHSRKLEAKVI